MAERDPCAGRCGPDELCVIHYDGGCEASLACAPNPLGCAPGACSPECRAHFCAEGHVCDGETCDATDRGAFRCYGP